MTSLGPLGNKQVRVEDSITLQNASAAGAGASAVNTVTVTVSGGDLPDGSYFIFSKPEPHYQDGELKGKAASPDPVFRWHVWYHDSEADVSVDPLPRESNQPGIKVLFASGDAVADIADATASSISSYFTLHPVAPVRASATTDVITIENVDIGRAKVQDGVGTRGSTPVAASTGFTFASATPGVAVDKVEVIVTSAIEFSGATGASVQQLVSFAGTTYSVGNDPEVTRVTMPADATEWPASAAAAAHFLVRTPASTYYVWYSVEGAATDPSASGTGLEVTGVASADLAASIAFKTASSINAFGGFGSTSFVAAASGTVVTLTNAQSGAAVDVEDVDASVAISVTQQGGGDWTITESNRFRNPNVDLETSASAV